MYENITLENTSKNPTAFLSLILQFGLGLPINEYSAFDVDISPSLSAICGLIGLLRSKKAVEANNVIF